MDTKLRAGRPLAVAASAVLLAACAVLGGGGAGGLGLYNQAPLDFVPFAINDQNLIVGVKGAKAVRLSIGSLTTLPFLPISGLPYVGIDVNRSGTVLGLTNVQQVPAVYWEAPGYPISGWLEEPPVGVFAPRAFNES